MSIRYIKTVHDVHGICRWHSHDGPTPFPCPRTEHIATRCSRMNGTSSTNGTHLHKLAFITRLYAEVERRQRHKQCIIPHSDRMEPTQPACTRQSCSSISGACTRLCTLIRWSCVVSHFQARLSRRIAPSCLKPYIIVSIMLWPITEA